jgi:hypothetical protein
MLNIILVVKKRRIIPSVVHILTYTNFRHNYVCGKKAAKSKQAGGGSLYQPWVVRGNGRSLEYIRENIHPKTCYYIGV